MARRLSKSRNNRVIAGVCGGIAEYFSTDATIIRLVCAAFALTGTGVIVYIVAAILMSEGDGSTYQHYEYDPEKDFRDYTEFETKEDSPKHTAENGRMIFGIVLIALGAMIFAQRFIHFSSKFMIPLIFVVIGVLIIFKGGRK